MLKWIFAGLLISFGGLGIYLYFHLGFYKSANLVGTTEEGFWLLYKEHRGAYHLISPQLDEVEKIALKNSISCLNTFGLFLDSPDAVAEDRLKSEVGCILGQEITNPPENLKIKKWEPGSSLHLSFDGSPSISPFKVYPKAQDWFAENRKRMQGPTLEVYAIDRNGHLTTHYYFPIAP